MITQAFLFRCISKNLKIKNSRYQGTYHFGDKDGLIKSIQDYVAHIFTEYLTKLYNIHKDSNSLPIELGKGYVNFFNENPHYFNLLFQQKHENTPVSLSHNKIIESNLEPFVFFSTVAEIFLKNQGVSESDISDDIITMWAIVHGIASLIVFPHFQYESDLIELTEKILSTKVVFYSFSTAIENEK